ncbi:MAG TPA: class I SAM-dependent methyltransferase [Terriglobales bacterium]|jgi:SAM-dependent methyltransferase|nr:class I SAM-dependent methyltransferase [Terriglobales bacterium]
MPHSSTERFSSRVDNYVRYRPGYPQEVIELLKTDCGLTSDSIVADIASGTGIFSKLLLENGNPVFGVEPNAKMRSAGEEYLAAFPIFTSIAGTAEATTLGTHSVDFVTAAQAAHWFNLAEARKEFLRILKPGGWVVLLWNERRIDFNPFLRDYEQLLLAYATDYKEVRHEQTTKTIHGFFSPGKVQSRIFETTQYLDYAALQGRLLSSSYAPPADHRNHEPMLKELQRIFDATNVNGQIAMEYNTLVYYSQLT